LVKITIKKSGKYLIFHALWYVFQMIDQAYKYSWHKTDDKSRTGFQENQRKIMQWNYYCSLCR